MDLKIFEEKILQHFIDYDIQLFASALCQTKGLMPSDKGVATAKFFEMCQVHGINIKTVV